MVTIFCHVHRDWKAGGREEACPCTPKWLHPAFHFGSFFHLLLTQPNPCSILRCVRIKKNLPPATSSSDLFPSSHWPSRAGPVLGPRQGWRSSFCSRCDHSFVTSHDKCPSPSSWHFWLGGSHGQNVRMGFPEMCLYVRDTGGPYQTVTWVQCDCHSAPSNSWDLITLGSWKSGSFSDKPQTLSTSSVNFPRNLS